MQFSKKGTDIRTFFSDPLNQRRLLMAVLGVTICGLSIAFYKQAAFGTDPFQCLCNGLNLVIPIPFGTLYMFICMALFLLVLVMDRRYIGIATIINLFLLGYVADFGEFILRSIFPNPGMALRVAYLIIGVVVMCYSSSLYFTAKLGVSVYDAIALHLAVRKVGPFRFIRIGTDLICVLVGFLLGYMPGVGTIITAFFMGPLISYFNKHCAEPMLFGHKKEIQA